MSAVNQPTTAPIQAYSYQNNAAGAALAQTIGGIAGAGLNVATGGTLGFGSALGEAMDMQGLINLQRQVQQETMTYTAHTNILKAHHDARMSAVRNMKS